jgi:hypothetical protein
MWVPPDGVEYGIKEPRVGVWNLEVPFGDNDSREVL